MNGVLGGAHEGARNRTSVAEPRHRDQNACRARGAVAVTLRRVSDLLTAAENISSANLKTIELMLVATFWYLVLTTITSLGQYVVERRLARSGTGLRGH